MIELRGDVCDLASGQQGLWLRQVTDRRDRTFNIIRVVDLPNGVERSRVQTTLNSILDKQDMLRSTFRFDSGTLRRFIGNADIEVVEVDHCGRPDEMTSLLERHRRQEFDLANGPLLNCYLVRQDQGGARLVLVTNHLCADGRSLDMVTAQIEQDLGAARDLDGLARNLTYGDFVAWEQDYLQSTGGSKSREYWKQKVAALGSGTSVAPTLRRARGTLLDSGTVALPSLEGITAGVAELVAERGISAAGVFAALWADALADLSGSWPVTMAVPVDARPAAFRTTVGSFANYVFAKTPADRPDDFLALARAMSAEILACLQHRHVPIEVMVSDASLDRSPRLRPFTQVALEYEGTPVGGAEAEHPDEVRAYHPVELSVEHLGGNLHRGSLRYDPSLHDGRAMTSLANHFVDRAHALLADTTPVPSLSIRPAPAVTSGASSAFRLIEATAANYGDRPAVTDGIQILDYAGLMARVAALRAGLTNEIDRDECSAIALHLERSVDLVTAVLTAESIGIRFVPLDPSWPPHRVRYVLEDSGASLVLADETAGSSPEFDFASLSIRVVGMGSMIEAGGFETPPTDDPGPVMYTMYTSGSTGNPKGVDVASASVSAFLQGFSDTVGIDGDTVLLALSSLSFDISLAELLAPLTVGGQVVVADKEDLRDLDRLGRLASENDVNAIQATPSLWRQIIDQPWLAGLRPTILCGGERLDPRLAEGLARAGHSAWNLYGPTEATIWVTAHQLVAGVSEDPTVPIGQPLPGVQLHVLVGGEPVGPWIPGELAIGGPYLAVGYHGLGDETAKRFAPLHGTPAYRTGDLVLARDDGVIEYLGRNDDQVKIRGFRIELAEVERWLLAHPDVQSAAAYVASVTGSEAQLRAAVVAVAGRHPDPADIGSFLRQHLPRYMIPSAYRFLDEMPLTSSDKIDRVALRNDDTSSERVRRSDIEPPRSVPERVVFSIVSELLHSDDFSMSDNFFDVGGDSLLAIEFVALVEQRLGCSIDFDQLFDGASFRNLALEMGK